MEVNEHCLAEEVIPASREPVYANGYQQKEEEEEEDEDEAASGWDEWKDDNDDPVELTPLCLFCEQRWKSSDELFHHCATDHAFDFFSIQKTLGLDFYECLKLINYIRLQVSENRCWNCEFISETKESLLQHLHVSNEFITGTKFPWQEDRYLHPSMEEDSLLHSFAEDDEMDDADALTIEVELMTGLADSADELNSKQHQIHLGDSSPECVIQNVSSMNDLDLDMAVKEVAREDGGTPSRISKGKNLKVSFAKVAAREVKNVNDNYFGSYGSFGIHKEMISDKVRTDTYRGAILCNPSLFSNATVLDVGCGTGILSMFAAQAGASSVIAVEASEKMASVAKQIAKENGMLWKDTQIDQNKQTGVVKVVNSMVEDLEKHIQIPPNSIDVLLSEWMGYCLLYESMLSSVLTARDEWLKPGGAILPDTATIFVSGFGKGATSIPFWEDVYGFDMSCIGKEVATDSSQFPIVDTVNSHDLVTGSVALHTFDLVTMKHDEMDFTASVELGPKPDQPVGSEYPPSSSSETSPSDVTSCYGLVLWFETGFTSRFCKDMPMVLSTSPYTLKTHWSQTILTFTEPIAISTKQRSDPSSILGTHANPATKLMVRISIARAAQHRSIDISVETTGVSFTGLKRSWPAQIFSL